MLRFVAERQQMAGQFRFRDLELLVDGPVEHLLIKIPRGREIAATYFEVHDRVLGLGPVRRYG
jgi:hypothetical protein